MNNYDCAFAVLERHRKGGQWTPEVVAQDLLKELDVDPVGEAKKATVVIDPNLMTEAQIAAAEALAQAAADKAKAARDALNAQDAALAKASSGDEAALAHDPEGEHPVLPPPPAVAVNEPPADAKNPAPPGLGETSQIEADQQRDAEAKGAADEAGAQVHS